MHSRKRNCLSSERVVKPTFLSYNCKLMNTPAPKQEKKEITKQASRRHPRGNRRTGRRQANPRRLKEISHLSKKFTTNRQLLESLPERQQYLLKTYKESLQEVEKCVQHNQSLIDLIVKDVFFMFENANAPAPSQEW
ncbi:hypothetical protein J6590_024844 [Homalodisca vitripennis]|nr:hypothetical protein J6590_024844 [Homalodisca vitripennis]